MKAKVSNAKPTTKPKMVQLDQNIAGVWSILPDVLNRLVRRAESVKAESFAPVEIDARELFGMVNNTAVIPVSGVLVKRHSIIGALFGGETTHAQIKMALAKAVADQHVENILLAIDSPGGTALGLQEVADAVQLAGRHKPVFAHTSGMMASAAYFIGSQASRIFVSADAWVGSIGVLTVIDDVSGAFEAAGIRTHVIVSTPLKGIGTVGAPVTDEHLAEIQRTVDSFASIFMRAVARGRRMSDTQVAKLADARMHSGEEAVRLGLADEVANFDEALVLTGGGTPERVTAEVPALTPEAEQPAPEPDPIGDQLKQAVVEYRERKVDAAVRRGMRIEALRDEFAGRDCDLAIIDNGDRDGWSADRIERTVKNWYLV